VYDKFTAIAPSPVTGAVLGHFSWLVAWELPIFRQGKTMIGKKAEVCGVLSVSDRMDEGRGVIGE